MRRIAHSRLHFLRENRKTRCIVSGNLAKSFRVSVMKGDARVIVKILEGDRQNHEQDSAVEDIISILFVNIGSVRDRMRSAWKSLAGV